MAVRIRLRRTGKRNAGSHRIVVADGRSPRDGRFIENIGIYDPRHKTETIDLERADYWVAQGAQPSETVAAIMKRSRAGTPMCPADKPAPPETAENELAEGVSEDSPEETAPVEAESEAVVEEEVEEVEETKTES